MILIQEILFLPPAELSWAVIQVRRKQSEFLAKGSRIKRYGFKTDLIYITRILKSLARVEILMTMTMMVKIITINDITWQIG